LLFLFNPLSPFKKRIIKRKARAHSHDAFFSLLQGDDLPYIDLGTGALVSSLAAGGLHLCALLTTGQAKVCCTF